jgi:hypothetical protein
MIYTQLDNISPRRTFQEGADRRSRFHPEKPTALKLARLLNSYLAEHKELTLPGIGHFTETPSAQPLPDDKKHAGADIHFRPDPSAGLTPALIEHISRSSGKMRPLAESDLESYLEIGRQLLNISKPFVIEGIGTLVMDASRQISFVQGEAVIHGEDTLPKRKSGPDKSDAEINFDENYLRPNRNAASISQRIAIVALVCLGIVLIGWVARYFGDRQDSGNQRQDLVVTEEASTALTDNREIPAQDAQPVSQPATDSAATTQQETPSAAPQPQAKTAGGFDIVLEVSKRTRALKRYADLQEWGHKVRMSTADSITFKLSIPIDAPLADSIRHRDSLSRFFGRKVWIETH